MVLRGEREKMMSEARVDLYEPGTGTHGDQDGPSLDSVKSASSEASSSDLQR